MAGRWRGASEAAGRWRWGDGDSSSLGLLSRESRPRVVHLTAVGLLGAEAVLAAAICFDEHLELAGLDADMRKRLRSALYENAAFPLRARSQVR